MEITKKNNKIYFNDNDIATANLSVKKRSQAVYLELIKVDKRYRRKKYATKMIYGVLDYLKENSYTYISLSPLPLEADGISLDELISFYEYFGFRRSIDADYTYPYLMEKTL